MNRNDPNNDLGFGTKITASGERLINKDGSFNVVRRGARSRALYQWLVEMTWPQFMLMVVFVFVAVNSTFAVLFMSLGHHAFAGMVEGHPVERFAQSFYFSTQTFTTVGYGAISPQSPLANLFAAVDALVGLMSFALATGLLFARFSQPRAQILFSEKAIITPYQGITSLQLRLANKRNNRVINLKATLTMTWLERAGGEQRRRFAPLPLERQQVILFPLNWTIVHPIDENSPLWGKRQNDLEEMQAEFLILVEGYDETFHQQVHSNSSYTFHEVAWDVKFAPMYYHNGDHIVLEMDKISEVLTG